MSTIRNVEIFRAGTHNNDTYTIRDLDDMVTAFRELDYQPALKIGHAKDEPGAPAYGWVRNLRRVGEKLYADFEDMHESVVDAIRKRAYATVSSEIYFNLKRAGRVFHRALKAVALLGAEVPAVANLVPLHKMQFAAQNDHEEIVAYEQPLAVDNDPGVEAGRTVLSMRVHELVIALMETSPRPLDYTDALVRVLRDHPDLAAQYRAFVGGEPWQPSQWEKDRETA